MIDEKYIEKFMGNLSVKKDCIEWVGSLDPKGYGRLRIGGGVTIKAHRLAYLLHHGYLPDLFICHSCDNPSCVNPDHLFAGTIQDNHKDMVRKGRMRIGVKHGRVRLNEEQVKTILATPEKPLSYFSALFGVHPNTIHCVRKRLTWRHL